MIYSELVPSCGNRRLWLHVTSENSKSLWTCV